MGISVDPVSYVGRERDEVVTELDALGLAVEEELTDNPGDEQEDIVISIAPAGTIAAGSTITVNYWGPAPEPEHEEPPPAAGPGVVGELKTPGYVIGGS